MVIDEFYKEQQALLLGFKLAWTKAHHERPDLFPLDMDEGEFNEALYMFDGNEYDTSELD